MKRVSIKVIVCLLAIQILLVSGCNFHLRNQNTLPPALQRLTVVSHNPYDNFTKQLKRELGLLKNSPTSPETTAQLIIHRHNLSYRMPIIGSSQQARIYRYTFLLEYSLRIKDNTLIKRKRITVCKLLTLNQGALLTTNNQQELLTIEIQQAAIDQLINELKSRTALTGQNQQQAPYKYLPPDMNEESPMLPYQETNTVE